MLKWLFKKLFKLIITILLILGISYGCSKLDKNKIAKDIIKKQISDEATQEILNTAVEEYDLNEIFEKYNVIEILKKYDVNQLKTLPLEDLKEILEEYKK